MCVIFSAHHQRQERFSAPRSDRFEKDLGWVPVWIALPVPRALPWPERSWTSSSGPCFRPQKFETCPQISALILMRLSVRTANSLLAHRLEGQSPSLNFWTGVIDSDCPQLSATCYRLWSDRDRSNHACVLAQKTSRDGYAALNTRAQSLFRDPAMARADGSLRSLPAPLSRIEVLVIDDWAMAPLSEPERRDFWEIREDRY